MLFLNIPLEGDVDDEAEEAKEGEPDIREVPDPVVNTKTFLQEHPMAKIVVIINTHCLENRAFVYTGNSPGTYEACSLKTIGPFKRRVCV